MPGDVLLICGECGCASDEHARGWAAFTGEDPDGIEPTSVEVMCPVRRARIRMEARERGGLHLSVASRSAVS
jgi:hypothetical protein